MERSVGHAGQLEASPWLTAQGADQKHEVGADKCHEVVHEVAVVASPNVVVDKGAVVIKARHTAVARAAVLGPQRLPRLLADVA